MQYGLLSILALLPALAGCGGETKPAPDVSAQRRVVPYVTGLRLDDAKRVLAPSAARGERPRRRARPGPRGVELDGLRAVAGPRRASTFRRPVRRALLRRGGPRG